MLVLGIETTCDETAASIVKDGLFILSNEISSSAPIHEQYGGVFPELASREHANAIIPIIDQALKKAELSKNQIDLIAVAQGPGLLGSLLIGLSCAKSLSLALKIPFIGVNHVEAHLYAAMMGKDTPLLFPALGIVVSGGHTFLVKIEGIGSYKLIGSTIDDAIGEAFDKVATLLDLPYPGGPYIEQLAKTGDCNRYHFQAGKVKNKPYAFSFSGLKTSVLYAIKGANGQKSSHSIIQEEDKKDIAASFQKTAFLDVITKSINAIAEFDLKAIYIGGGVSNNLYLRSLFSLYMKEIPIFFPPKGLSLDNGAMIAGLGYHLFNKTKKGDLLDLEPMTRMPLVL